MDTDTFCRQIESYLCRKNDGHLVRVVGPAFGMVSGWAAQGVPFKVACRGIDRCFERYYAKGPRRRPIRVEFCEADVLDVFDDWKRAVGVGMSGASSAPGHSLRAHLDRAVTRLTDLQAKGGLPPELEAAIERVIDRLGKDREASRTLRGEAREQYVRLLAEIDGGLLEIARQVTAAETQSRVRDEAAEELSDYRARMAPDAYERAVRAAAEKLLREHWKLPVVAYRQ